jgi:dimethylamine monooxygenase subunit A
MSKPARYFPIESGRYEVKPGLFKFGTDFGNGDAGRGFQDRALG